MSVPIHFLELWKKFVGVGFVLLMFSALFLQPAFSILIITFDNWRLIIFVLVISIPVFLFQIFKGFEIDLKKDRKLRMGGKLIKKLFTQIIMFISIFILAWFFSKTFMAGAKDLFDREYRYRGSCDLKRVRSRGMDSYYVITQQGNVIRIKQSDYMLLNDQFSQRCRTEIELVYLKNLSLALKIMPILKN